ncbi:MAG: branched-chain amino acid ABC transporter permease, partial [Mycobacteriales bacterium]
MPVGWRRLVDTNLVRHGGLAVLGGVVLFVLSGSIGAYRDYQVATAASYVVAVAGLTLLTGQNGQISLGHGALMAIGAYTTAVLTGEHGWPMWAAWFGATLLTALAGAAAGAAAARLRGPYLAGATLALAIGVPPIALYFSGVLGGDTGLSVGTGEPASFTTPVSQWQMWVTCLGALIVLVLLANLNRSRFGRAFRAVRDDEVAAAIAGLSVARTQVLAFVVSAGCAGLAGAMFATVVSQVSPGAFPVTLSLQLLTAIVLGGLGSLTGAVWGSAILVALPDLTQNIGGNPARAANVSIMIYGAMLAAVMIFFPGGIQGALRRLYRRVV